MQKKRRSGKIPKIVATFVCARSQGQRTHSARTKIDPPKLWLYWFICLFNFSICRKWNKSRNIKVSPWGVLDCFENKNSMFSDYELHAKFQNSSINPLGEKYVAEKKKEN